MKLSPISLIAVLAAVAGSATAAPAPAPRPFERDVDIYSRVNKEEAARHWLSASLSDQAARDAHASGNHGLAAWHKKGSEIDAAHMKPSENCIYGNRVKRSKFDLD